MQRTRLVISTLLVLCSLVANADEIVLDGGFEGGSVR